MKIHSNVITEADIATALHHAEKRGVFGRVHLTEFAALRSRSHSHAYQIYLRGDGTVSGRPPMNRTGNYRAREYAATWCQWGDFLGYLFHVDPAMKAGPYKNAADFDRQTEHMFDVDMDGEPNGTCGTRCSACKAVDRKADRGTGHYRDRNVYPSPRYTQLARPARTYAPDVERIEEVSQADIVARISAEIDAYERLPGLNFEGMQQLGNTEDDPCGYRFA